MWVLCLCSCASATHGILALRVEWSKTRARAARWREEILLLEEEMRRSIESCLWRSHWWQSRAQQRAESESHIAEGLAAYAWEQSLVEQHRAICWATQWSAVRDRARSVLEGQQSSAETYDLLPELVIELEDEEGDRDDDQEDYQEDEDL